MLKESVEALTKEYGLESVALTVEEIQLERQQYLRWNLTGRLDLRQEVDQLKLAWELYLEVKPYSMSHMPWQYGYYSYRLTEWLPHCINVPTVDELRARHQEEARYCSSRYYERTVTSLANAYAALLGIPGMPQELPKIEFRNGVLVNPEEFTEALRSQGDFRNELERIEKAVGERLGNGDYEKTPMFDAQMEIIQRIKKARLLATLWASLLLILDPNADK